MKYIVVMPSATPKPALTSYHEVIHLNVEDDEAAKKTSSIFPEGQVYRLVE